MITVTPYCMNDIAMMSDVMERFTRRSGRPKTFLPIDMYDARQPLEVDTDQAEVALEKAWTVFQNLSDGEPDEDGNVEPQHMTPDGGRSLMVGDLAVVQYPDGRKETWSCCSMGWERAPWHDE